MRALGRDGLLHSGVTNKAQIDKDSVGSGSLLTKQVACVCTKLPQHRKSLWWTTQAFVLCQVNILPDVCMDYPMRKRQWSIALSPQSHWKSTQNRFHSIVWRWRLCLPFFSNQKILWVTKSKRTSRKLETQNRIPIFLCKQGYSAESRFQHN